MIDHPLHTIANVSEPARPVLTAAHKSRGGADAEAFLAGGFSGARALNVRPGFATAVRAVA